MRIHIHMVAAVLLACWGIQSFGQQRPGLAGDKQAPGMQVPTPSPPGEQDTSAQACQSDLARLQKLVADQRSYIALLEQKVQSLQPPTQPASMPSSRRPATASGKARRRSRSRRPRPAPTIGGRSPTR